MKWKSKSAETRARIRGIVFIPNKEEKMHEILNDTTSSVSEKEDESTQFIHQEGKLNLSQWSMREDSQTEMIGTERSYSNETEFIHSENNSEGELSILSLPKRVNSVLRLVDKENGGKLFEKVVKDVIIIGRRYELCDIAIDYDKTVSSRQCKVYIKNKKLYVSDLGGTNITYLNDKPLREDALLNTGDVLGLGRVNLRVTLL